MNNLGDNPKACSAIPIPMEQLTQYTEDNKKTKYSYKVLCYCQKMKCRKFQFQFKNNYKLLLSLGSEEAVLVKERQQTQNTQRVYFEGQKIRLFKP